MSPKLKAYLALGRPSNLPTVWTNVIAGSVLADPYRALELELAILMLAISFLYTGGMFLNDAFDREWDARERPERPIPSGIVTASEAFVLGFGQLAAGIALVGFYGNATAILWALVLAAAITMYDAFHKRNPAAPFIMGACRGLVYVTAGAAATGTTNLAVIIGAFALLFYVVGLTFVARQENLASFTGFWPLVFLSAPAIYAVWGVVYERGGTFALVLLALFIAWVARAIRFLLRKNIPAAVVNLIAGISIADALAVSTSGRAGIALFCTLGCLATLRMQRWVRGT